jgi:hypothetical protein
MVEQEDVVEIDDKVTCVNEVGKDVVHKRLECSGGVAEAKGHNKGFEESEGAFESGFPFVAFANADVIIAPTDVKLGKVAGALEFIYEVRD